MIILWWYNILLWRKVEGGRFELEDGGNFPLRNQQSSYHLIRLGSFLPLELRIMS